MRGSALGLAPSSFVYACSRTGGKNANRKACGDAGESRQVSGVKGKPRSEAATWRAKQTLIELPRPSPRHRYPSAGLTANQCANLQAAARFADATGRPLNRFVSVRLSAAGMLEHWLKWFRDWLHRHGHQAAYLWVREGTSGDHAHILLHLPAGLRLGLSRQWTARAAGGRYTRGAVRTKRIRGASDPAGALYAQNLERLVNYVTKGATPAVAAKQIGRASCRERV